MGAVGGLSPRVRGNRPIFAFLGFPLGSIPACAGEPRRGTFPRRPIGVYPRVCGGTDESNRSASRRKGLSPRVRGNLRVYESKTSAYGSIPACAGEPPGMWRQHLGSVVYPRVCGGTTVTLYRGARDWGLSPRVRGNQAKELRNRRRSGSIPACAGEPASVYFHWIIFRVYPRVCGGTRSWHGLHSG